MSREFFDKLFHYAKMFNEQGISKILDEVFAQNSLESFIYNFIVPLLSEIGKKWEDNEILPIHEHFLSEIISSYLNQKKYVIKKNISTELRPNILIATIEPEGHSLGIKLVDIILTNESVNTIFIGERTPLEDIVSVSNSNIVDIIALSFPLTTSKAVVEASITFLREHTSDHIEIWFGGGSSNNININKFNCKYLELSQLKDEVAKFRV